MKVTLVGIRNKDGKVLETMINLFRASIKANSDLSLTLQKYLEPMGIVDEIISGNVKNITDDKIRNDMKEIVLVTGDHDENLTVKMEDIPEDIDELVIRCEKI